MKQKSIFSSSEDVTHSLAKVINEGHFFANSHKILNIFLVFIIWVINFGSVTFMSMTRYFNESSSKLVYGVYLFFTGSPAIPNENNRNEIVLFVWFYFILSFLIFLVFASLLYMILFYELTFPILKKSFFIITLYVIPIMIPLFGKSFTASLAYLTFNDDPLPFLASICGELSLLFYSCFISMQNSLSAYKIPHLYFQKNTISSLIVNFFTLFMQHSVSFLETTQTAYFVIAMIIFVVYAFYVYLYLPYSCRSMNIIAFLYSFFCTGCSVIRAFPKLQKPLSLLVIVSVAIVFTIIMFLCRCIFEAFKGNLYKLLSGWRIDASKEIMNVDLTTLDDNKIMILGRSIQYLNEESTNKIYQEVKNREKYKQEQSVFLFSLESILTQRRGGVLDSIQTTIDRETKLIADQETKFWKSLWLSDFEALPKFSSDVGRTKQVLSKHVEFQKLMNPSLRLDNKFNPFKSKKCSPCPFYITYVTIIFLVSIYFHGAIYYSYTYSMDNQEQFFDFRAFMTNFTMMQSEVWDSPSGPKLGFYYNNTVHSFNEFVNNSNAYFSITEVFSVEYEGSSIRSIFNQYLNAVQEANQTRTFPDALKESKIFEAFEYSLNNPIRYFDSKFDQRFTIHKKIWVLMIIILVVLIIISFIIRVINLSKHLHKSFQEYSTFSKKKVAEYGKVNTKMENSTIIPRKQTFIEWPAVKINLFSFTITLLFFVICIGLCLVVYNETFQEYNSRAINLAHFNRMDLVMMWLSNEIFQNRTLGDDKDYTSIYYCDAHLDYLMRREDALDFVNTIPGDIITLIGYYVMGVSEQFPFHTIFQIDSVYQNLSALEIPMKNQINVFYIRWILFLLLFVFFCIVALVLLVIGYSSMQASISERRQQITRFKAETNSPDVKLEGTDYNSTDLPLLYIETDKKDTITFITHKAKDEFSLNVSQKLNMNKLGISVSSEISKSLQKLKEEPSGDVISIKLDDGTNLLLLPTYGGAKMDELLSVSLFKLPTELNIDGDDSELQSKKFYTYFPSVISAEQPFPQIVQINAVPFLLIHVKLVGFDQWCDSTDPQTTQEFFKLFIKEADSICHEDNKFMRVYVRDDSILFMTNPEIAIQGSWTFITNCAEFGRKIINIARELSNKFSTNIYASTIFARGEKQMMYIGDTPCTQADFLPESLVYLEEAVNLFNIEGIGFAVVHRPNLRIPNTTLIKMFMSNSGQSIDLFLVT